MLLHEWISKYANSLRDLHGQMKVVLPDGDQHEQIGAGKDGDWRAVGDAIGTQIFSRSKFGSVEGIGRARPGGEFRQWF